MPTPLLISDHAMRTIGVLALCLCSAAALAQNPAPAPDPLVGTVALGYLATSGNTDSTNTNASFKLTWDRGRAWAHNWTALAVSARTNGVTTAEAYAAGYKAQRALGERAYLFASGDWRQDQFSGYDRQATEAVGYGRKLLDNDRQMLSIEGGLGSKQSTLIDGTDTDEGIVRGDLDYLLHLGDNSQFNQKLLIESGSNNRYTESTSALKAKVRGNLAIVLSYVIKNNSDVPVGIENTDRFTAVSLEYGF
jgi:putative salt-induced outer membrane protein